MKALPRKARYLALALMTVCSLAVARDLDQDEALELRQKGIILPLEQLEGVQVMTGGDVCEPYVIEQLTRQGKLHNLYGPTEATVLITARQLKPGDSNRTLGAPIANSQVLILDDDLQPVPQNTVGELFIVGPGVCLGYLNNPQQTAERYLSLQLPHGQTSHLPAADRHRRPTPRPA